MCIRDRYKDTVQPHITWVHPTTCVEVKQPEWGKASIRRHLLYSGHFPQLFKSLIAHIYRAVIAKQNESMIDADTGMVIEDHRKAFCDTVESYRKWSAQANKEQGGSKAGL